MLFIKLYAYGELCLELVETTRCQTQLLLGMLVVMGLWLIQTES